MKGIGIQNDFKPLLVKSDGTVDKDPQSYIDVSSEHGEFQYIDYYGKLNKKQILPTGEQYNWYLDGFLKKKEDTIAWYDEYGWIKDKKIPSMDVNSMISFQKQVGDKFYLIPQIGGIQLYESLWVIMGQARFSYYSRKDPDYLKMLINDRKEAQLKILDEIARVKPEIIFGGDDLGQKGRPLMSPTMFRKFFKEPYTEIFTKIHEEIGAQVFQHSCGNITELLPDFIEAGLDGWQSLEPAALIDHAALKKQYPELLFVGGLDSREISFGTPESIKKHVQKQFKSMGKNGGYITGPTHDFLTKTPLDNVLTMRDAIQSEMRY